jgi:hypothetical protein
MFALKGGVAITVGFTSPDIWDATNETVLANKRCAVAHFKSTAVSLKIKYHAWLSKLFMSSDNTHEWVMDCVFLNVYMQTPSLQLKWLVF